MRASPGLSECLGVIPSPLSCPSLTPSSPRFFPPCGFSNSTTYFQVQMCVREHIRSKRTGRVSCWRAGICPLSTPAANSRGSSSPLCFSSNNKLPRSVKRLRWQHMPAAISPQPPSVGKRESKQLIAETFSRLRPTPQGSVLRRRLSRPATVLPGLKPVQPLQQQERSSQKRLEAKLRWITACLVHGA